LISISYPILVELLLEENGVEYGKGSTEAIEQDNRIHNKLPCFYLKDKIPDQPSFENIRNTQKSTSTPAIIPLSNVYIHSKDFHLIIFKLEYK